MGKWDAPVFSSTRTDGVKVGPNGLEEAAKLEAQQKKAGAKVEGAGKPGGGKGKT